MPAGQVSFWFQDITSRSQSLFSSHSNYLNHSKLLQRLTQLIVSLMNTIGESQEAKPSTRYSSPKSSSTLLWRWDGRGFDTSSSPMALGRKISVVLGIMLLLEVLVGFAMLLQSERQQQCTRHSVIYQYSLIFCLCRRSTRTHGGL